MLDVTQLQLNLKQQCNVVSVQAAKRKLKSPLKHQVTTNNMEGEL